MEEYSESIVLTTENMQKIFGSNDSFIRKLENDYSVYVGFVLPESPLAKKGGTRGAKLTGIKEYVEKAKKLGI